MQFQVRAWCQGWARDWAGLASACGGHVPPWARLCPLPALLPGEPGTPAQASWIMLGPGPLLCPTPEGRGAPELPEAAGLAENGLWPMPRLYVPADIFFPVKSPLAFLFNANLEHLSQETWIVARKKI